MKETFKQAGYTYIKYLGDGEHLLRNSDGINEVFASNKNHASWGLKYKNTHLEFCRSLHPDETTLRYH
jgi:hypothetical protein